MQVLKGGGFEFSVEILELKGCLNVGLVRFRTDSKDGGHGFEPLPSDGRPSSSWRTSPGAGWHASEKNGAAIFIDETGVIRSGSSKVLAPGWKQHLDSGARLREVVVASENSAPVEVVASAGLRVLPIPPLDAARHGEGVIAAMNLREKNCIVQHEGSGLREEYLIGQVSEYHLAVIVDHGQRRYYFRAETGESAWTMPIQGGGGLRLAAGDVVTCRCEGTWVEVHGRYERGDDGVMREAQVLRCRAWFLVNDEPVGEASDLQGPFRFGLQLSTRGDRVKLLEEREVPPDEVATWPRRH